MKLVVLLFFLGAAWFGLYLFLFHLKKIDWKLLKISGILGIIGIASLIGVIAIFERPTGNWCDYYHTSNNYPPGKIEAAMDFFELGNFYYDIGKCDEAIHSFTKSIELNDQYPEAYNNRAYTYMRMEKYDEALADLNRAIELNPEYKNALMNRADVNNYHKNNKKAAIDDYEKILSFIGARKTDVCAHLADAKYGGSFLTALKIPFSVLSCR